MKINIQKAFKCLICLIACFMVVVCTVTAPVNATTFTPVPGNYDPTDFIYDITISGETKTIRYDFSEIRYAFRYWDNYQNTTQDFVDKFSVLVEPQTQHLVACYPFGVVNTGYDIAKTGGALFVGDLLPGSPIDVDFELHVCFEWKNWSQAFDMTLVFEPSYHLFDVNGAFLNTVNLDSETLYFTFDDGTGDITPVETLEAYPHVSCTIPADASYILPVFKLRAKNSASDEVLLWLNVQGVSTTLSVDINTVLENSNQMQAINDKLGDIITGGLAGDELEDATGNLDDSSGKFDDTLGEYQDKVEQLPTTPSNFDDIIDDDLLGSTIEDAQKIFDWDASGLQYMSVPMGISLSLAVLFYVVFGRS